jgi:hypothetical protein
MPDSDADLESLLRDPDRRWTDELLRGFAAMCCGRVSRLCSESIYVRLLDLAEHRAGVHPDEVAALRAESLQIYETLYRGYGAPSAAALALTAAGEAAFTESTVDAAINASATAAMALAAAVAASATSAEYDAVYEAAYRRERTAQLAWLADED